MRRPSTTGAAIGAMAFVACVQPFPAPTADTDGATDSGEATRYASGDASTSTTSTTSDGSTSSQTDGGTSGSESGGETSAPDATGALGGAVLEIDGGPQIDLGLVQLGDATDTEVTMTNTGTHTATSLAAEPLASPFSFAGGAYPGAGGTCAASLAPREACTMVLRFAPEAPVLSQDEVRVTYDGAEGGLGTATRDLEGGGTSPNLIVNPGAESGLEAWTVVTGNWMSSCGDVVPHAGDGCFSSAVPTDGAVTSSALRQDIDLGPWADAIDSESVVFSLRGWARSHAVISGDPWRIRMAFRDEDSELAVGGDSDWQETYTWTLFDAQATMPPPGTRVVRVRLDCVKPVGHTFCDAYFDELELVAQPAE